MLPKTSPQSCDEISLYRYGIDVCLRGTLIPFMRQVQTESRLFSRVKVQVKSPEASLIEQTHSSHSHFQKRKHVAIKGGLEASPSANGWRRDISRKPTG